MAAQAAASWRLLGSLWVALLVGRPLAAAAPPRIGPPPQPNLPHAGEGESESEDADARGGGEGEGEPRARGLARAPPPASVSPSASPACCARSSQLQPRAKLFPRAGTRATRGGREGGRPPSFFCPWRGSVVEARRRGCWTAGWSLARPARRLRHKGPALASFSAANKSPRRRRRPQQGRGAAGTGRGSPSSPRRAPRQA